MSLSHGIRTWLLAGTSMVGLAAVSATPAAAFEVETGSDLKLTIDTTISTGAIMRVDERNCALIALNNGGCLTPDGYVPSQNLDDPNINHDQWDVVSAVTKFTTDISAEWGDFGAFARVKGYYDAAVDERFGDGGNGQPNFNSGFFGTSGSGTMTGDARDRAIDGIDFLDYFVYGNFDVDGHALQVRLGSQAVNWGESLIFQGGVNSYLPVDVTALRAPGAELKEALMPQPTVYVSLQLTSSLSLEAMYIYDYVQTELDACGSYFAGADFSAFEGCRGTYIGGFNAATGATTGLAAIGPFSDGTNNPLIGNLGHRSADNQGQFGLAARYYAEDIFDGTEFGLYFTRSHLKAPILSIYVPTLAEAAVIAEARLGPLTGVTAAAFNAVVTTGAFAEFCALANGGVPQSFRNCLGADGSSQLSGAVGLGASSWSNISQHPEDIDMFGLSMSTTILGQSVAAEIAYYPDAPQQVPYVDTLTAAVLDNPINQAYICDLDASGTTNSPAETACISANQSAAVFNGFGADIDGYRETETINAQFSTISLIQEVADVIGSNTFTFVTNFGFQYLPGIGEEDRLAQVASGGYSDAPFIKLVPIANRLTPFETCAAYFLGSPLVDTTCGAKPGDDIYASEFSAAYRVIMSATYPNVFGLGVQVTPSVQWRHDVYGNSAGPLGPGIVEGVQAINLGLGFDYLASFRGSIQYNAVWGNQTDNLSIDKDYVTIDLSYSF